MSKVSNFRIVRLLLNSDTWTQVQQAHGFEDTDCSEWFELIYESKINNNPAIAAPANGPKTGTQL